MMNRIYEKIINCLLPIILIITVIPFSTINTQDESLVENIKKITVQLTSIFPNGTKDYGFGFVVGEREGLLYIATARHVVVKYDDEEGVEVKASSVTVRFYDDQGRSFDDVTILEIKKDDLDISLLRIPKPNTIFLTNGYFSPTMQIGEGVWFIGREREWKIPQSEGFISEEPQYDGTFEFESSTIKPGTSGAPLFTNNGIVGLIITDNQNTATAIHISFIEMLINNYNYPWSLNYFRSQNEAEEEAESYTLGQLKNLETNFITSLENKQLSNILLYTSVPFYAAAQYFYRSEDIQKILKVYVELAPYEWSVTEKSYKEVTELGSEILQQKDGYEVSVKKMIENLQLRDQDYVIEFKLIQISNTGAGTRDVIFILPIRTSPDWSYAGWWMSYEN